MATGACEVDVLISWKEQEVINSVAIKPMTGFKGTEPWEMAQSVKHLPHKPETEFSPRTCINNLVMVL